MYTLSRRAFCIGQRTCHKSTIKTRWRPMLEPTNCVAIAYNSTPLMSMRPLHTDRQSPAGPIDLIPFYQKFISDNTKLVRDVPLVPEIRLRLITSDCELYRAGENELAVLRTEHNIEAPFWGFAWPGGATLARYIIDNPHTVKGKRVLDIGAGCGIVALACRLAGASHISVNDIDDCALASCEINAHVNNMEFDCFDSTNLIGGSIPEEIPWDVVLAGDICYDDEFASLAIAWLKQLAARGVDVVLGDPGRPYLPRTPDLHKIAEFDLSEAFIDENHGLSVGSLYRLKV
ncbi:50S ribosomal protein L11 methyltransferase [Sphaeroforma arctica JP610]|uniref:ETFB lysine methyltransferase n=1 Tax=Sphaeroforma arctica JP610 TaxID=667725 RepID=A0A0L0GD93_9EUKA|nr:50S ribosomal protein L11 methyltransferase [Sphaeroforma arctica JP610]KNC86213.1 50S ribosomal protein L11 methyltransferase [Sphaeroforma arctica JP610]|eukprot:XP_014160115.1 50S ribosomal protein L11 methyltransferase [Sphaeroforma arctica JP610]